MAARNITHDDFTVAWICALPLEMAAAEAILDEKYEGLATHPKDQNTYTLGRVQSHNIVIACLPLGVYGTISASIVAAHIEHTFKSIRYSLMVGIGGGVPSKDVDIRLGDVVVSKPTRDFGGVIQYDYGKTVSRGSFQRTGMLNKPPPILLTALSKMQAQHMLVSSKISSHFAKASIESSSSGGMFTYCGIEQDILFESSYDHGNSAESCENCDSNMIVKRPLRSNNYPVVHYGLVASGNQVMKHAPTRDALAKELGVLCFDMEASGLMDNFPCLVIRGICDYADSHKNKQWQEYAAATASAYAKELLHLIHPSWSSHMPTANSIVALNPHFHILQKGTINHVVRGWNEDEGVDTLLNRLSSYDHEKSHQRISRKKLAGTTQWFFDHPRFQRWFAVKQYSSLWCTGKIGSGKTIIASAVVEMAKCRAGYGTLTVFFYCSHANDGHQAIAIISSFIKQICSYLLETSKPIPQKIHQKIVKLFGAKQAKPDFEDMERLFIMLFPYAPNTIYVLDGLELVEPEQANCLLRCIKSVFCSDSATHGCQILLVSREQMPGFIDISTFIPGIETISTSSNVMHDIELFINESIADKTMMRRITDDMQLLNEMRRILLTESSNMFLWVFLQIEIIWDTCFTDKEIRSALWSLPKDLEETYQRCMRRINIDDVRAVRALMWVSYANRPLHIEELREAVAFDIHDTEWDGEQLPRIDFILGSCANLITMDLTDYGVYFAHSSVKQFLENFPEYLKGHTTHPRAGDLYCGEFCVAYLSFSDFAMQLDRPQDTIASVKVPGPLSMAQQALGFGFNKLLIGMIDSQPRTATLPLKSIRTSPTPDEKKYRFLNYAIENWALHTKKISVDSCCWEKFQRLATTFNETWNFHPWVPRGRSMLSHIHSIFGWAVKEQHEPLLRIISTYKRELQLVGNLPLFHDGLSALHVACKLGHGTILPFLLSVCNVNVTDEQGQTALHYAAARGHTMIVKKLINTPGCKIDGVSRAGCTPLWLAASHGYVDVLEILLNVGPDIEFKDRFCRTPVLEAARNGHFDVVRLLVSKGVKIDHRDLGGNRPIDCAFKKGHYEVTLFLFRHGSQSSNEINYTLILASMQGHHAVVWELLSTGSPGINIEATDDKKRTSLLWAAKNGHLKVVKCLLRHGANLETRDVDGKTPLAWACERGHVTVTYFLISQGAEITTKIDYDNILIQASKSGDISMIHEIFSTKHANISTEATDDDKRTALSWAAGNGNEAVTIFLLDKGASVESRDIKGRTPLLWASRNGRHSVLTRLIRKTVDDISVLNGAAMIGPQMEGYMMQIDSDKNKGEWRYYSLCGLGLLACENPEATLHDVVAGKDELRFSTAISTTPPFYLDDLATRSELKRQRLPLDSDIRLFFFSLIFLGVKNTPSPDTRLQYFFAVRTEQERIYWLREFMLLQVRREFY